MPDEQQIKVQTDTTRGEHPTRSEFETLKNIMYAIIVVACFAVITLIIQYFTATQATFQNLVNQINEQGAKIDQLQSTINAKLK
jgi:cell division protein FtsL